MARARGQTIEVFLMTKSPCRRRAAFQCYACAKGWHAYQETAPPQAEPQQEQQIVERKTDALEHINFFREDEARLVNPEAQVCLCTCSTKAGENSLLRAARKICSAI